MTVRVSALAAAGLFFIAAPAAAESWRVTGISGEAPDRAVYLVDVDSIRRNGDKVNFDSMTVWEVADADMDSSRTQREGDCWTRMTFIVRNSFFLDGRLTSEEKEPTEPVEAKSETMMGDVLDAVCGRLDYVTDPVANPESFVRGWFAEDEDW
jgi:hypothetical protein